MGTISKIARRTFLVGSSAVTGGVMFGVYSFKKPIENPNLAELGEDAVSFNPWVVVDREKVTLITPHADKGQGVVSVQAQLLAEELDLEWGGFETSFGAPAQAYWNQGMAASMTEQTGMPMAPMLRIMGMQVTGGSSSVRDSYDKLRHAAASARETLKAAAALETGVAVEELKTDAGAVVLPDGSRISYPDLSQALTKVELVQDVTLRDPSEWKLIAKPLQRLDVLAKSTGTQNYGIDMEMEGMVYASVRTNPRKGGGLNGYDDVAAREMRGVIDVVSVTGGAAVIADNTWRAIQAVNAIDFDWAKAPYPAEQDEHWQSLSESFTDERFNMEERNDGDVDAALSEDGAQIIEAEYRSPYVAHQPLEPLNATVLVTNERVDIWAGQQIPRQLEKLVSDVTGHNVEDVHFHNQFMGGSFGHRLEFENLKQAAEIGNKMRGTPVKLTYSREEDFAQDFTRNIAMGRPRGAVKDGQVVAYDFQIAAAALLASQGARSGMSIPGPDPTLAEGGPINPYTISNIRSRSYAAPDLAPTSSWRAVGSNAAGFFFDSFLDELIHEAGADPLEERIRLMGDEYSRKVLEAVGEMSNWGSTPHGRARGVSFVKSFDVPTAEIVEISDQNGSIKIEKVWVAAEVGRVLDPVNFENLVQGGVIWGLGHAMNSEITYSDGMAEQMNYYDAEGMRIFQAPEIMVKALENSDQIVGIGEPPVPPAAPALANAIFALRGERLREMPFNKFVDFV